MNLVYGISQWTNPSRASARHIDDDTGRPLCKDKRRVLSWEREQGQPTCRKCLRILEKAQKEIAMAGAIRTGKDTP